MAEESKETTAKKPRIKGRRPALSMHLKTPPWLRGYVSFRVKEILEEGGRQGLKQRKRYMVQPELSISIKDQILRRLRETMSLSSAAWRTASIELSEYLKGSPDANMCTCIRALNIVNAARRETDADLKLLRRLHGELGEDVEKDSCHLKVDPVRLSETVLRLMGFQDCSDNENAQYQAHMVALRDTDIQIHTELCQTINWALVIRRNIHMHDLIKEGNKKIWEALGKIVKADAIKSQEGYLRRTSDLLRWQLDEHVRENVSGGAWQYLEMVVKLLTDSWVEDGGDGVGSTKVVKYDGGRDVPVA